MRKFEVILGGAALVVLGVSAALYIANHPLRRSSPGEIRVGSLERDPAKVGALDVLRKGEATVGEGAAGDGETTPGGPRERFRREPVVYPNWEAGAARIIPNSAQAVTDSADYALPVWSPVGLDIAMTRLDKRGVFLAGPQGTRARMLTDAPGSGADFAWNLDGMSLHLREPDGQFAELMVTGEKYPAAPRSERVFERDGMIIYQPDEGDPLPISGAHDRFSGPRLSPDGNRVVYLGRETGIYLVNTDGTSLISVGRGANPSWLPDSSGIVFDVPVSDGAAVLAGDLWYAGADGREKTNLTNTPDVTESQPAVSPDGARIAFVSGGRVMVARFVRPPVR
jgi:hypothetical protein